MIQFNSREDINAWISSRPNSTRRRDEAMLNGRAALRILPLVGTEFSIFPFSFEEDNNSILSGLIFPIFFVSAMARLITLAPKRESDANFPIDAFDDNHNAYANSTALVARGTFGTFTARAAFAAVAAAFASGAQYSTNTAADKALLSLSMADNTIYSSFANHNGTAAVADAEVIEKAGWQALINQPLWPRGVPKIISENWNILRSMLSNVPDWAVWIDFYTRLRDGKPQSEDELAILTLENAPYTWKDGPEKCNRWITEQLAALRAKELPDAIPDILSVIDYGWTPEGLITVIAGSFNLPSLRAGRSEQDHANRLLACQTLISDIKADLAAQK